VTTVGAAIWTGHGGILAIAWGVILLLSTPSSAQAHAYLIRSSPAARAVITTPSERVDLWFNERLEPAYAVISVWKADRQRIDARDGRVDVADPSHLSVGVPPLPAGVYTVRYRVVSVDGHVVEAEFTFTVRPAR
jgi:methionine-rich copper-binding protein CopC